MQPDNSDLQVQILRRPAVQARTGLSTSTLYASMERGTFPKPVSIGAQAVGWLAHEVDAWIADRIAARDAKTAA